MEIYHMGEVRNAYNILDKSINCRNNLGDLHLDGSFLTKWLPTSEQKPCIMELSRMYNFKTQM